MNQGEEEARNCLTKDTVMYFEFRDVFQIEPKNHLQLKGTHSCCMYMAESCEACDCMRIVGACPYGFIRVGRNITFCRCKKTASTAEKMQCTHTCGSGVGVARAYPLLLHPPTNSQQASKHGCSVWALSFQVRSPASVTE